ncbi:hypothetical protein PGT21_018526 [Puccinia graminis f. sp. tritici]|uniref:Uncharacterized protein n=1 Tax=Puccinia graminis f. sp. tritici TaxID=56615 RepID=A0A5B0LIH9_PUCGR|nr:hypothetical protein PGTUg99_013993 [Puccinia graminis f. sp. tritici]KAA1117654.1 hypothetical protein PGT21_018526 [Puccinia graminis f. sp. tritici]
MNRRADPCHLTERPHSRPQRDRASLPVTRFVFFKRSNPSLQTNQCYQLVMLINDHDGNHHQPASRLLSRYQIWHQDSSSTSRVSQRNLVILASTLSPIPPISNTAHISPIRPNTPKPTQHLHHQSNHLPLYNHQDGPSDTSKCAS